MPSRSSSRSCCISIFCETPGIARFNSEKRRTPFVEQMEYDDHLPSPLQHLKRSLDAGGGHVGRDIRELTCG